ncbi:MAG: prephenate dehydrogenase/arogenate dehydrogenase family protein [Candidatus Rokuibacteriota bacterium]|nr:MAG: prephenate dehydrogenase/arogenate dehydrogenase family protein [Candidatus Rokubacteria bacterium]
MIERLAIIGVGLLGGSVAKAARATGVAREIVGVGRDLSRLSAALSERVLDRATIDLADGVRGADFVVLGATVFANESLLETLWPVVPRDAVVTDVGSTKAGIVNIARRLAGSRPVGFVGSHPMAGSDRSGYGFARADLFQGATVIVTPTEMTDAGAVKRASSFWETFGAHVSTLDPELHDRVVAAISHLPHLVAYALVEAVERFEPAALAYAARGFKDTTRIAASDQRVWQEIFLANRAALRPSLEVFRAALAALETLVDAGEPGPLEDALAKIRCRREALR